MNEKKYTIKDVNIILELLTYKYYNYYYSVYYEFIKEAIYNTFIDYKLKKELTLEEIHQNIKENYI